MPDDTIHLDDGEIVWAGEWVYMGERQSGRLACWIGWQVMKIAHNKPWGWGLLDLWS